MNTRQPPMPEVARWPAVKNSVVNYVLPDISSLGLMSAPAHRSLRIAIGTSLRTFEPRLTDVHVTLESTDAEDRRLRFHIEGTIELDPAHEEISFDTVLELSNGGYKVK